MANQGDRIHNALYAAANAQVWPVVSWDPDTGLRTTDDAELIRPATCLVREIASAFDLAESNRRVPRLRERTEWTWEVTLRFDRQVSVEEFEAAQADAPIFLPRTAELDQQATLELTDVQVVHPPEQQPSSGTRATFTYTASLSRK